MIMKNMNTEEKNELVAMVDGEATTTSLIIAEGTGVEHASIMKLIRNNLNDFNEFGLVRFEIRPRLKGQHGGGDTEYAILNERHSTLLFSYMRNSEIVKQFKIRLVKKFYEMRDDGTERITEQVMVLPKGLTKLATIVPREAVLL